ncbi:MAG: PIN domain-containing protein [Actinobacteria bacterium]|nr:PIN domain-containing protein [Actinomycetota bacterium]
MDRLFLDANVLFSAAYGSPSLNRLWDLASNKKAILLTSAHAIEEARRNLEKKSHLDRLEHLINEVITVPEPVAEQTCPISLDRKDVPVFMAALSSKATHFITGDIRHFGKYFQKVIEGVLVCTPANYLNKQCS